MRLRDKKAYEKFTFKVIPNISIVKGATFAEKNQKTSRKSCKIKTGLCFENICTKRWK